MLRAARAARPAQLANKLHPRRRISSRSDGGAAIAAGNGRVVRARLADARHFWLTDLAPLPDYKDKAAKPLDQRLAKLERWHRLPREARHAGRADRAHRGAGARACAEGRRRPRAGGARGANSPRPISSTEMVGEFPELQGLMGRYYATRAGRGAERRRGDRGALQAARAERPRSDGAGLDRGRARRQARHAGRLLGDRREADRQQGPLCAAARGAGRDPDRAGERAATCLLTALARRCGLRLVFDDLAREAKLASRHR